MSVYHSLDCCSFRQLDQEIRGCGKETHITLAEKRILPISAEECEKMPLSLSNTDFSELKSVALLIEGKEKIVLDFQGSVLECEGQLQPLTILNSRHVAIRNLTVDWKIPLSAEGIVLNMTNTQMELRIDSALYPFQIREGRLFFLGNGEPALLWEGGHTVFHPDTMAVCMGRGDELNLTACALLSEDIVRFTGDFHTVYRPGSVVVLRHSHRLHAGIFVENCEDVRFENVIVHATGGLGILCQFNRDLAFDRVSFRANTKKGRRVVNGHDDGLHLANNAGLITVENCYFHGLMDDPMNVHGLTARIEEVVDGHTVKGRYMHDMSAGFRLYARPDDLFSVIRSRNMHSVGTARADGFELLDREHFLLRFSEGIPEDTRPGDALENLTNTPSLICRNNYFGACRARGILVSTPRPVRIEDNLFQSAGSAVLIAGDANYWYESGACRDVLIARNSFTAECMASRYEGCEGIISLCPVVPKPDERYPFHRNIKIEENTFFSAGATVLYAFCTENLTVRHNRIFRSRGYGCGEGEPLFLLKVCRQVCVEDNCLAGEFSEPFVLALPG